MGAFEGFQSLFGHSLDPILHLFSLLSRVHWDQDEFEYDRVVRLRLDALLASV